MTADLVNVEHLRHLIAKYAKDDKVREHLEKLLNGTPGRVEVIAALEKLRPGTEARLATEWRDRSAAVHPFIIPIFDTMTRADILQEATGKLKRSVGDGARHVVNPDQLGLGQHLVAIQLVGKNILDVEMDIVSQQVYNRGTRFQETLKTTTVVSARMHLDNTRRLTEVYCGYDTARDAMGGLIEQVFGLRPQKRDKLFAPSSFTDAHVRMTATRLGLAQCRAEGAQSPGGKNGRTVVEGIREGARRLPIDTTEREAKAVVDGTNNERMYLYDHKHQDGFVEPVTVQFTMRNIQSPGVLFIGRTSNSAKIWLLTELL